MKKGLAVAVVLALLGATGWQVYRKIAQRSAPLERSRSPAVAVEVAPVGRATVRQIEDFTGTLEARSRFLVAPKIAGRLEKLLVNTSDPVTNGQLVAVLDDQEYAQQVKQDLAELQVGQAGVDDAQISLELAKRELDRVEILRQKKIASESELDGVLAQHKMKQARLKVAQAQVAQKNAVLGASQVRLSYTQIHASWDGPSPRRVIGEKFVDTGAMLKANDPIVSVYDLDVMTAILSVTERDYSKLFVGQKVAVTADSFPQRVFDGAVARIAPLVKEASREARVEVEIPNADHLLKPGMFLSQARVELAVREGVTVVPTAALVRREGRQGVLRADLKDRKAYFVPVTVGIIEEPVAEILAPALSGHVVVLGQHLLEDGSAILVVQDGSPGAPPRDPSRPQTSPASAPVTRPRP